MTDEKTCDTCVHMRQLGDHAVCVRFPPAAALAHASAQLRWPLVQPGDYCGEHKRPPGRPPKP